MRAVQCALVAVVLAAGGCGEAGPKVYNVSGSVTFAGKPLPAGIITFDPDASKGTEGRQGVANVINGRYTTAVNGFGVRAGTYHVRILGFDGKGGTDLPMGKTLFTDYTATKDLPAADSVIDFDISAKR